MAKQIEQLEQVTIRFAGDSGDGMQLTGGRFTSETALVGNDLSTLPDFPAEIRAPAGSLPGVSEAIYLRDPDGNGIELYRDRPEEEWPRPQDGDGVAMFNAPLDLDALVREAS